MSKNQFLKTSKRNKRKLEKIIKSMPWPSKVAFLKNCYAIRQETLAKWNLIKSTNALLYIQIFQRFFFVNFSIRGVFKELCKMGARGQKNSLSSGSKLLEKLLRSPLNVCTVEVKSDLSMGLYWGWNWGHVSYPNVWCLTENYI